MTDVRPAQRSRATEKAASDYFADGKWDEGHASRLVEIAGDEGVGGEEALAMLKAELDEWRDNWIEEHSDDIIHDYGGEGDDIDMMVVWAAWRDGYLEASKRHIADLPARVPGQLMKRFLELLADSDPQSMLVAQDLVLENKLNLAAIGEELYEKDVGAKIDRENHESYGLFGAAVRDRTWAEWSLQAHQPITAGRMRTTFAGQLRLTFAGITWTETTGGPTRPRDAGGAAHMRLEQVEGMESILSQSRLGDSDYRGPHLFSQAFARARRYLALQAWNALYQMKRVLAEHQDEDFLRDAPAIIAEVLEALRSRGGLPDIAEDLVPNRSRRPSPAARAGRGARSRSHFVQNPAWVTHAIAAAYESIAAAAPPAWLPKLDDVRGGPKATMVAKMNEYGCGAYGCVLPTMEPAIVLKVTTDRSEADFASRMAGDLVAPICVTYEMVMSLAQKHEGRDIFLLWRESAQDVGKVEEILGTAAAAAIELQHRDAARVLLEISQHGWTPAAKTALEQWLLSCRMLAKHVPELATLATGLVEIYRRQNIFIGDTHEGNLGRVNRDGEMTWVITDPGNVIVLG